MAQRLQISCINKEDRYNPYEKILRIGGLDANGSHWSLSQEKAIDHIEKGKYSFYVSVYNKQVNVIVAISPYGNKYLKTEADDSTPNNLLNLEDCPLAEKK